MNPELGRRLLDLERAISGPRGLGAVPDMVTVLRFADDSPEAVEVYVADLRAKLGDAGAALHVEVLDLAQPRPAHLKPAWSPPRQWIDYTPHPAELADLRPDLRPPAFARVDWNPDAD